MLASNHERRTAGDSERGAVLLVRRLSVRFPDPSTVRVIHRQLHDIRRVGWTNDYQVNYGIVGGFPRTVVSSPGTGTFPCAQVKPSVPDETSHSRYPGMVILMLST
jgi:hypothetical protein